MSELPNEGCGLLAMDQDRITAVYPTRNLNASPTGYTVPPDDHFAALADAESRGWALGGVFHSHPHGPAELSSVDVASALEPEWLYVVVGLAEEPVVRGWTVSDGEVQETSLD